MDVKDKEIHSCTQMKGSFGQLSQQPDCCCFKASYCPLCVLLKRSDTSPMKSSCPYAVAPVVSTALSIRGCPLGPPLRNLVSRRTAFGLKSKPAAVPGGGCERSTFKPNGQASYCLKMPSRSLPNLKQTETSYAACWITRKRLPMKPMESSQN